TATLTARIAVQEAYDSQRAINGELQCSFQNGQDSRGNGEVKFARRRDKSRRKGRLERGVLNLAAGSQSRSEEHTSELQSRRHERVVPYTTLFRSLPRR